jgi:hypothetical protein
MAELARKWGFDDTDAWKLADWALSLKESVNEAKAKNPSGHYSSYSAAVQAAEAYANELGYEVEEDEWFQKVSQTKKPGKGKTVRITLGLIDSKTKKETKKGLAIQVFYNDSKKDNNVYELNCYVS